MPIPQHSPTLLQEVANLPSLPGVYRYFDENDQLLYVGKAINLKKRVSSYFQKDHGGTRVGHMVSKIVRMETTVVRSEAEALLLENNLIKTLHPKYNILFRDDKSYPYLKISSPKKSAPANDLSNHYPRVSYYRGATDRTHRYFGPYPNAWAVKETIQLLQKVFLLRTCEDTVFNNRTRPCLLYQIKRCSGPCVGHISQEDYAADVQAAQDMLHGKTNAIIRTLEGKMMAYAEKMEYEMAAATRDRIASLSSILHQQSVETSSDIDADILAVHIQGGKACVNLAMVRGGRHLGDRPYFPSQIDAATQFSLLNSANENETARKPHTPESESESEPQPIDQPAITSQTSQLVLEAFMAQHYLNYPMPPILITDIRVDPKLIELLGQQQQTHSRMIHAPRGNRRTWLEMAQKNAQLQLARLLADEGSQKARTQALAQALQLDLDSAALDNLRIECFDISHTSGEATQASCVVFQNHQMQHSEYRRYNITGIQGGDDYAAMRQVLQRRYGKLVEAMANQESHASSEQENPESNAVTIHKALAQMPDLVFIDGGKGQISSAKEIFSQLGLDIGLLVGVEKGEGRKVGLEELVFADGRPKISLPHDSAALMLVAQIRDEAHRFAITGMRAKRAKVRTSASSIENIAGIGAKRRAKLLQRFGGVRGVAAASIEDLASVEGISHALATTIYQALH